MIKKVLGETIVKSLFDISISENNQACIADAENHTLSDKSKHIDLKCQFFVDNVRKGNLRLRSVTTENVVADMFTKNLSVIEFCRLVKLAGMSSDC